MSTLIYALCSRLFQILAGIGVGTNLGLYQVFFALLSGRCLQSRGALFPALTDSGLPPEAVRAHLFEDLVLADAKPGSARFRIVVIFDPRYKKPLVLGTNKPLTAYALWCIYADRWPVEQMPLAAKQMLGCERSFVHNDQSRWRLPELSMLAGNLLSYVAACGQAVATGFWDRAARPTCGRVRRLLGRLHFSDLPLLSGQVRKKNSPTAHLPKGVAAHRRKTRYFKADKQGVEA